MINLSKIQRKKLEALWFIYGNNGKKHTNANHGYIQGFLQYNEDREKFYLQGNDVIKEKELDIKKYGITQDCINKVKNILN